LGGPSPRKLGERKIVGQTQRGDTGFFIHIGTLCLRKNRPTGWGKRKGSKLLSRTPRTKREKEGKKQAFSPDAGDYGILVAEMSETCRTLDWRASTVQKEEKKRVEQKRATQVTLPTAEGEERAERRERFAGSPNEEGGGTNWVGQG